MPWERKDKDKVIALLATHNLRTISKTLNVPLRTLKSWIQQLKRQGQAITLHYHTLPKSHTFSPTHQRRLVSIFQNLYLHLFSVNNSAVAKLAFQYAEYFGIAHEFSICLRRASARWVAKFRQLYPEIIQLRYNSSHDMSALFFERLNKCYANYHILPSNIWILSGIVELDFRVCNIHSNEKIINVLISSNAIGQFFHPFIIFPPEIPIPNQDDFPLFHFCHLEQTNQTNDVLYTWLENFTSHRKPNNTNTQLILISHCDNLDITIKFLTTIQMENILILRIPKLESDPLTISFLPFLQSKYFQQYNAVVEQSPEVHIENLLQIFQDAYVASKNSDLIIRGFHEQSIIFS